LEKLRAYGKKKVSKFAAWLDKKYGEAPAEMARGLEMPKEEDCDLVTELAKQAKLKAAKAFKEVCLAIQERLKKKTSTTLNALTQEIEATRKLYVKAQELNMNRKPTPSRIWDASLIQWRMAKLTMYEKLVPKLPQMTIAVNVYQIAKSNYQRLKNHLASTGIGRGITTLRNRFKSGGVAKLQQEAQNFETDLNQTTHQLDDEEENQQMGEKTCLEIKRENEGKQ